MTSPGRQSAAPPRQVSPALAIGIIFLPLIFAWFTLRRGYSDKAKIIALLWMAIAVFLPLKACAGCADAMKGSSTARRETPSASVASAPQAAREEPAAPPVAVDAIQLWNDYDANEVSADEKYKGKILIVSGVVNSIDKDYFNNIIVKLRSPNRFLQTDARMESTQKDVAMRLRKGQKISIVCLGGGKLVGSPQLQGCMVRSTSD